MKLEQIALILVIIGAVGYFGMMFFGLASAGLPVVLLLAVAAVGIGLLAWVIIQRLNNAEDDYYEKNIEE